MRFIAKDDAKHSSKNHIENNLLSEFRLSRVTAVCAKLLPSKPSISGPNLKNLSHCFDAGSTSMIANSGLHRNRIRGAILPSIPIPLLT